VSPLFFIGLLIFFLPMLPLLGGAEFGAGWVFMFSTILVGGLMMIVGFFFCTNLAKKIIVTILVGLFFLQALRAKALSAALTSGAIFLIGTVICIRSVSENRDREEAEYRKRFRRKSWQPLPPLKDERNDVSQGYSGTSSDGRN
jgi:hypothetical protein